MKKELRRLVTKQHNAGYTTRVTTKHHLLVLRERQVVAYFAGTLSDHHSWRNSLAPSAVSASPSSSPFLHPHPTKGAPS